MYIFLFYPFQKIQQDSLIEEEADSATNSILNTPSIEVSKFAKIIMILQFIGYVLYF